MNTIDLCLNFTRPKYAEGKFWFFKRATRHDITLSDGVIRVYIVALRVCGLMVGFSATRSLG